MEENNIDGRIQIKKSEIQYETDPNKKAELQRDLEILNLRKQIETLKDKIEFKRRNR
jgi:hypothetical protein